MGKAEARAAHDAASARRSCRRVTPVVRPEFYRAKEVQIILAVSDFEVRRLANVGILHKRPIGEKGRQYRITAQSVQNHSNDLEAGRY